MTRAKAILMASLLLAGLALTSAAALDKTQPASDSPATQPAADDPVLRRLETKLRAGLKELGPDLTFIAPPGQSSLEAHYKSRPFVVHGADMTGEWSEKAYPRTGPSHKGFIMRAFLQKEGEVNQAKTPQTLVEPYWRTNLSVVVVPETGKQLYLCVNYGSGVDDKTLGKIQSLVSNLK
ncbi:MAG: hypothetical protein NTW19_04525 [Planctomycetota bacterium]|nr:hypothetical protein [Planctomycetota bacterium]